jgi:hypothetical protein
MRLQVERIARDYPTRLNTLRRGYKLTETRISHSPQTQFEITALDEAQHKQGTVGQRMVK